MFAEARMRSCRTSGDAASRASSQTHSRPGWRKGAPERGGGRQQLGQVHLGQLGVGGNHLSGGGPGRYSRRAVSRAPPRLEAWEDSWQSTHGLHLAQDIHSMQFDQQFGSWSFYGKRSSRAHLLVHLQHVGAAHHLAHGAEAHGCGWAGSGEEMVERTSSQPAV